MQIKNKLYKHHRSKFVLVMRNFSIVFSSLVALVAIVAIPTYITERNVSEAEAKKENNTSEVADSPTDEETPELETYN